MSFPASSPAPPPAASITRTVVHARKKHHEGFQPAEFGRCLLDYFDIHDDFGRVECWLENNIVYLQPPSPQGRAPNTTSADQPVAFRFQHPPFCVAHKIKPEQKKALPPETLARGVDVGVSVLLEASDGHLLMTRRAQHMRTFPGVWVPPGGHVEEGETLVEAGLREVMEETGLEMLLKDEEEEDEEGIEQTLLKDKNEASQKEKGNPSSSSPSEGKCRVLGLWESLYPPVLYMGEPTRHHLVVYLHIRVPLTASDLQRKLKLDSNEVDACLWLTQEMAEVVVFGSNRPASRDIPITLVNTEGEHVTGILNPKTLRKKMPEPGFEVERLTTGTRYALKLWLEQRHGRDEMRGDQVNWGHVQVRRRRRNAQLPAQLRRRMPTQRRIFTTDAPVTSSGAVTDSW
nr:nucleoside diphosphate-linked moiety X motif 17-like [Procambarus clarkii]